MFIDNGAHGLMADRTNGTGSLVVQARPHAVPGDRGDTAQRSQ